MIVSPTWQMGVALVVLITITIGLSLRCDLRIAKQSVIATLRAIGQLGLVSLLIVGAIQHIALSIAFTFVMFGVAVYTTAKRTGVLTRWWWPALAMAAGLVPVLATIFLSGTMPFTGTALIPISGIIIGNMMTAHTLSGRRLFPALRDNVGIYEAGLSLGLSRPDAIATITTPLRKESLIPTLDTTATVGIVTLPGAFVGVLLGGGSPVQAAAAQVLVLVGILAGQTIVVLVTDRLVRAAYDLPDDLQARLRP